MRRLLLLLMTAALAAQQPTVEELFQLGLRHAQSGDHANARNYLTQALRLAPRSVPVLNNLGAVSLAEGQTEAAAGYFHKVLTLAPSNRDALYNLGLIELRAQRYLRALPLLRKAAASPPQDLQTLQALLLAELESKQRPTALAPILKLAPARPEYFVGLAAPLVESGHDAAAKQVLQYAIAKWPNQAELHHLLGEVRERGGDFKGAADSYQAAVHHAPGNDAYWLSLGYEFLLHRNFDTAERVFQDGLERLPNSQRLQLGLASTYLAWAQKEKAIAALRRAVELAPESDAGYFVLGKALTLDPGLASHADSAWLDATLRDYQRLKPNDALPLYLLARGGGPEAANLLTRALTLDPAFADAHVELGNLHASASRWREAVAAYESAIRIEPEHTQAHFRLSQAWFRLGDAEKGRASNARHQAIEAKRKEVLLRREREIQRFILAPR